jgi:FMN reductase [NAD(P)H]
MNDTLKLMQEHRSTRSYTDREVSAEMLDEIICAAWRSPSSINAQEVSVVVVTDAAKRARISEIAGGQPWIARAPVFITVIVDFNKTRIGVEKAGYTQVIQESMEGFGVAAVDCGIVLGNLMTAARSFGLGVVPIGGIRRDPQAMIDLLELPAFTFPLVGLCIGHIDVNAPVKPRMDISTFRHNERYDAGGYKAAIDNYDVTIMEYWRQLQRSDGQPWSTNLGNIFKQVYFPDVKPVAAKQGLLNDK